MRVADSYPRHGVRCSVPFLSPDTDWGGKPEDEDGDADEILNLTFFRPFGLFFNGIFYKKSVLKMQFFRIMFIII